jgi:hypothetical protein
LLYPEATRLSGLFPQEKATLHDSGNGYVNSETALGREGTTSTRVPHPSSAWVG